MKTLKNDLKSKLTNYCLFHQKEKFGKKWQLISFKKPWFLGGKTVSQMFLRNENGLHSVAGQFQNKVCHNCYTWPFQRIWIRAMKCFFFYINTETFTELPDFLFILTKIMFFSMFFRHLCIQGTQNIEP